jgi:hypothetical protein
MLYLLKTLSKIGVHKTVETSLCCGLGLIFTAIQTMNDPRCLLDNTLSMREVLRACTAHCFSLFLIVRWGRPIYSNHYRFFGFLGCLYIVFVLLVVINKINLLYCLSRFWLLLLKAVLRVHLHPVMDLLCTNFLQRRLWGSLNIIIVGNCLGVKFDPFIVITRLILRPKRLGNLRFVCIDILSRKQICWLIHDLISIYATGAKCARDCLRMMLQRVHMLT